MINARDVQLATMFGLGSLRPAPGTWGSLPPLLIAGGLIALGLGPADQPVVYLAVLLLIFVLGCIGCVMQGDRAEVLFLAKDPSNVVADEVAGMCLPLMFLPAAATADAGVSIFTLIYAFICFRVMDIIKPPPAAGLQRIPGGWGILLDDLMAAFYAMILVQVVTRTMLG